MHSTTLIRALALAGTALSAPSPLLAQRNGFPGPCYIIGDLPLGDEITTLLSQFRTRVSCIISNGDPVTTIAGVPNTITNAKMFSSVNYDNSTKSPLRFALDTFQTSTPLVLEPFENNRDLYVATEAGMRSVGANLTIVPVRLFLQFQIARIKKAVGIDNPDPEQQIDVLLARIMETANRIVETQATLDEITALASVVA